MAPHQLVRCWERRQGAGELLRLLCPRPGLSLHPITPTLGFDQWGHSSHSDTHAHSETGPEPVITWLKGLEDIAFAPFSQPPKRKTLIKKGTFKKLSKQTSCPLRLCGPSKAPLCGFTQRNANWLDCKKKRGWEIQEEKNYPPVTLVLSYWEKGGDPPALFILLWLFSTEPQPQDTRWPNLALITRHWINRPTD